MGMLIEIEGKMDADKYCQILSDGMVESFEKLEMEEGEQYFQQDNDPKHTSQKATQLFEDNNIEVLPWPAQSLLRLMSNKEVKPPVLVFGTEQV